MNNIKTLLPQTFLALEDLRKNDIYLPQMDRDTIVVDFFPETIPQLVQCLSDITAAFYGGMLKQAGDLFGPEAINQLSTSFFYNLGATNAMNNLSKRPELKSGLPDTAKILIATIFTSSPEYSFEFIELDDQKLVMLIKGQDRYHRIARSFNIENNLTWPVIKPFIEGICAGMKLNTSCKMDVLKLKENSTCLYKLSITLNN
ncbi:hypothetical protein ACP3T3_06795 [Chryseobacterium sp. CBSDS_008]|uniref:hypothetical protein n=1 Tax=Chryseobacterium sp. CBSDS_008 TaxID=3415265 RepID=UPI003CF3D496